MKKDLTISILLFVALISLSVGVYAGEPTEPHSANAMWVEPSTIELTNYSIGSKFNITVWANVSTLVSPAEGIDTWQVKLYFDKNYLKALRAGYTEGTQSQLFKGLATVPVTPIIDNNAGYVFHGETCAPSWKEVPCYGSLFWVEFNVTALTPAPIYFMLNITNPDTALVDNEGNIYPPSPITRYNGQVIPEFSSLLVPSLIIPTLIIVVLKTRKHPSINRKINNNLF